VFGDQYSMELTGADYSKKTTTFWKYKKAIAINSDSTDNHITDDINDDDDDINETVKKSLLLEMKNEMKNFKKRLDNYETNFKKRLDNYETDLGQVKAMLNIQPDA
jgi:hypothetical protein